jgi:uncharacterized protein YcbX
MANAAQIEVGSVVSLWRYPVKSMMGELSLLKSRPVRFICILRIDPIFGRSWSDGSESSSGH